MGTCLLYTSSILTEFNRSPLSTQHYTGFYFYIYTVLEGCIPVNQLQPVCFQAYRGTVTTTVIDGPTSRRRSSHSQYTHHKPKPKGKTKSCIFTPQCQLDTDLHPTSAINQTVLTSTMSCYLHTITTDYQIQYI